MIISLVFFRDSVEIVHTQWNQLRWNLSQSAETLRDGVGYREAALVSAIVKYDSMLGHL